MASSALQVKSVHALVVNALPSLLAAAAFIGLLSVSMTICAEPSALQPGLAEPVEAQFRGCDSAGWCRFWIEPLQPSEQSLYRVRPDGVLRTPDDAAISSAVRDRLNALLASMIHQSKRIVLRDLRELDDGTFAAAVTVNGANVASDPILLKLREKRGAAQ
jgi:hypothetical protein